MMPPHWTSELAVAPGTSPKLLSLFRSQPTEIVSPQPAFESLASPASCRLLPVSMTYGLPAKAAGAVLATGLTTTWAVAVLSTPMLSTKRRVAVKVPARMYLAA